MSTFTALGSALLDALEARIDSVLTVPMRYRGEQSSTSDYIHVVDDDDHYTPDWSDKDGSSNDCPIVLAFWGSQPRTLQTRAKTLVDSISATPLSVSGFYHLRTVVERNAGRPALTIEGQAMQYSRQLQIRFFYHPNP